MDQKACSLFGQINSSSALFAGISEHVCHFKEKTTVKPSENTEGFERVLGPQSAQIDVTVGSHSLASLEVMSTMTPTTRECRHR